jgi:hypothetical protein
MIVSDASSFALYFRASAVPDSMMIAFEIFISCQIQPELWEHPFYYRHLGFPVERYVQQCRVGTIEKFDPEDMGVAAGILFLPAL